MAVKILIYLSTSALVATIFLTFFENVLKSRDLEKRLVLDKYPVLKEIKDSLVANGALNSVMSGSGPTIFGIFEDEEKAKNAYENLKGSYKFVYLTKTLS